MHQDSCEPPPPQPSPASGRGSRPSLPLALTPFHLLKIDTACPFAEASGTWWRRRARHHDPRGSYSMRTFRLVMIAAALAGAPPAMVA
jgi:hypothetical protein